MVSSQNSNSTVTVTETTNDYCTISSSQCKKHGKIIDLQLFFTVSTTSSDNTYYEIASIPYTLAHTFTTAAILWSVTSTAIVPVRVETTGSIVIRPRNSGQFVLNAILFVDE